MIKQISSIQNSFIKEIIQLQEKSRIRKKKELFIIEGYREIVLALKGGYTVENVLFCNTIKPYKEVESLKNYTNQNFEIIEITSDVYQKIAVRKTTEGIIAISKFKNLKINNLKLQDKPLILIAEAPEKPGNIGALLRTADAAKLDAVIIANPKTDFYNPNIIRSSVGCIFTNKIATGTTSEIIDFLVKKKINMYSAVLDNSSKEYTSVDYTDSTAIIVGTEATGLSKEWLKYATRNIIIPMHGEIDSLNVSVSAAIIIFEAKRQRKEKII